MKKKILALALVGAALLSGCASVPKDSGQNPDDPWETLNRQTFAFNQGLDFILILGKGLSVHHSEARARRCDPRVPEHDGAV